MATIKRAMMASGGSLVRTSRFGEEIEVVGGRGDWISATQRNNVAALLCP